MDSLDLILTFTLQLFLLVDPVAGVPVLLAITPNNTSSERRVMARRGCLTAFGIVLFFLLFGQFIMDYLGIRTPAVRICGGVLLFVIALEMLYGRFTGTGTSRREERLAGEKADISITPLAVPLLAGPGALTTALIFADRARSIGTYLGLIIGCALVFTVTYLFFSQADRLMRVLGNLGASILTRIMGLVLAFLAVQYVVDGLQAVFSQAG